MGHGVEVLRILRERRGELKPVLPFDPERMPPVIFDLSAHGQALAGLDLNDVDAFSRRVFDELRRRRSPWGIGRYAEDRLLYRHRSLFSGEGEARSVHMGIDLFAAPGTRVSTPLAAEVHSFAFNDTPGDYGPTIILRHLSEGVDFFTLYGHLSRASLDGLAPGRRFAAGDVIARIGGSEENGGWPPHLHFQLVSDMGRRKGDFPGVVAPSQLETYRLLCPDPNLILRIPELDARP